MTKNNTQKEHSLPSSDESSNDAMSLMPNPVQEILLKPKTCELNLKLKRKSEHMRFNDKTSKKRLSQKPVNLRRCKPKRLSITQILERQVRELEFKQINLLSQVENLQLYKRQLELKCKQACANYKLV